MGIFRKGMSRRRLKTDGARAPAEILDIRYTNTKDTHGPIFAVKLAVRPPEGSMFEVDAKINASIPSPPGPGQVIPIRYDPDHPSSLIWDEEEGERQHALAVEANRRRAFGTPQPTQSTSGGEDAATMFGGVEVVNASGADAATVVAKLQRVRDQGLISEDQFQAAKQQVEEGGAGSTASSSTADSGSGIAERLQRLDELRRQHLVSDEEYAAERQRILDSI